MSNFTKSIFYSGAVLAVAMIAVFSIYTNMTQNGSELGALEPAAGEEAVVEEGALEQAGDYISNTATDAAAAAKDMAQQAAENAGITDEAGETAPDAAAAAPAATEGENADATAEAEKPAAHDATEPAAGEAIEPTEGAAEETAE